jgi:hypothetical protein
MEPTFQRKKHQIMKPADCQGLNEGQNTVLQELLNPVYCERLLKAYRRIEEEYQRCQQIKDA